MLKNYFKTAFRNLIREKIYTIINILGLSVGMTCAILLYLYIDNELHYDSYHKDASQIYRVASFYTFGGKKSEAAASNGLIAKASQQDFPKEIVSAVRVFRGTEEKPIAYARTRYFEKNIIYADSNFFDIFTHKFLAGNPKTALAEKNNIVLTKSMAKKLFGTVRNAMGKEIHVFDYQTNTVTAIIEDVPINSHFHFPAVISLSTVAHLGNFDEPGNLPCHTYIKVANNVNIQGLEDKINHKTLREMFEDFGAFDIEFRFILQAIQDIHLYSKLGFELEENADVSFIYIFSAVALFILIIASINYVNLATARSVKRAKEVGIRKVVGSHSSQLFIQFLLESCIITVFSLLLSLSLVELVIPSFNVLSGKDLNMIYNFDTMLVLLSITFLVTLLSGAYPAFVLTRFQPITVLKGKFANNKKGLMLRKTLVIFQFSLAIIMLIGTGITYQQLNFIKAKDLGYNPENVISTRFFDDTLGTKSKQYPELEKELLKNKNVKNLAFASAEPTSKEASTEKMTISINKQENIIDMLAIDDKFADLINLQITKGRNFSMKNKGDSIAVLVNEKFVKEYKLKNPIGQKIGINLDSAKKPKHLKKIVGVVKDFHLNPINTPITPTIILFKQTKMTRLFIKIASNHKDETLRYISKVWGKYDKKFAFDGQFLSKRIKKQYENNDKIEQIFIVFSLLTIIIACLGLLGLAAFTAEQRTKEVGIRKVLGASVTSILRLVSRDFMILVSIASLIAIPVAYFVVDIWLRSNFVYRINVLENWFIFLLAGFFALFIALITISFQAMRVTKVNPIDVLKDE